MGEWNTAHTVTAEIETKRIHDCRLRYWYKATDKSHPPRLSKVPRVVVVI